MFFNDKCLVNLEDKLLISHVQKGNTWNLIYISHGRDVLSAWEKQNFSPIKVKLSFLY